ncbi:unnamed protein product [Rhizoctonia solani]|uniref:VASt domain-containing protein n=1 Tax=Rhizoctonia solani TaxID=456999 RepID=A0A8H3B1D8_9AGAM|nr:unnamed protein product [Rhizoctonia solani]
MRIGLQLVLFCLVPCCFGVSGNSASKFGHHFWAQSYDGAVEYEPGTCVCGRDPQHYPNVIADVVLPTNPETVFNLMYSYHDEIQEFWTQQGMHDLRTIGWVPQDPSYSNSRLRTRTMLFSKDIPEGLRMGHKTTRVQVTDTITHLRDCPFSSSVLSTVYTPDLASGHAFAIKTRTCITSHAKSETRLLVTAVLVWGDESGLQQPIGQAAFDGLRQYHDNIVSIIRDQLATHKEVYASLDEAAIVECRNKFRYVD